ncbi:pyrimidine 5'-nucleotidase [Parasphingorhabdus halotolerans]|uniref:Pyrimidine 5'-nucleotidase n=1 Tax=Parasphingorhabdus halotolerans TaxID=2725558 RepID=A0A6H2DNP8_9SPHN|nr:pyrimidine 5'-nucleotidase [Parasphingorhabdus halotolerans]QJB69585.1 pyrimidine 5'-nucleotidase [Parasphingorhabdus halotolerans]
MPPEFSHIDHWIFDLDNVLYPAECDLFALIDIKMGEYVAQLLGCDLIEARTVQKSYFHDHGTTLAGLMHHHAIAPQEFLDYVHDIDMDRLSPSPDLRAAIEALPGEKLVFTNADRPYAERVLERRGLGDLFHQMHDILDTDLVPKPQTGAYHSMVAATGVDPKRSLFVEDMARNLRPAKDLGMTTIWVNTGAEWAGREHDPAYIDHEISELESWVTGLHHPKEAKAT